MSASVVGGRPLLTLATPFKLGSVEQFLKDYVKDVNEFDRVKEEEAAIARREAYERRMTPTPPMSALRGSGDTASADRSACVRTPTPGNNTGFHALRS